MDVFSDDEEARDSYMSPKAENEYFVSTEVFKSSHFSFRWTTN